jgi:hypothetical protein
MAQTPAAPSAAASAPTAKPVEAAKPKAPVNELETVLVIGTRQSQQSAISRKKNAATAQDSIVAEDVGAFPDRNIGEAISRIAGVALDRGDYGEGVTVSIRTAWASARAPVPTCWVGALKAATAVAPSSANCQPTSSRAWTSSRAPPRP